MRYVLVAALLSAAFAAPASAGCTREAQLPRVTVPAASTSVGGSYAELCDEGPTSPVCPNLVTSPGASVPGVVEVTPLVVNNCHV